MAHYARLGTRRYALLTMRSAPFMIDRGGIGLFDRR